MSTTDLYARLEKVFARVLAYEPIALAPETTAEDVEGWDSLNHIKVILSVEKEFGVKFTMTELNQLKNVGSFVKLIETKLATKS